MTDTKEKEDALIQKADELLAICESEKATKEEKAEAIKELKTLEAEAHNEAFEKRHEDRLNGWAASHSKHQPPPVIKGDDGKFKWVNRKVRRAILRDEARKMKKQRGLRA